mmetsp:Transcript_4967/g.11862  ORF Transcript_4967/g.11862 Transcript_4967/m.11862 type:complete len:322 (-) Transcript_4967:296-1261(-)
MDLQRVSRTSTVGSHCKRISERQTFRGPFCWENMDAGNKDFQRRTVSKPSGRGCKPMLCTRQNIPTSLRADLSLNIRRKGKKSMPTFSSWRTGRAWTNQRANGHTTNSRRSTTGSGISDLPTASTTQPQTQTCASTRNTPNGMTWRKPMPGPTNKPFERKAPVRSRNALIDSHPCPFLIGRPTREMIPNWTTAWNSRTKSLRRVPPPTLPPMHRPLSPPSNLLPPQMTIFLHFEPMRLPLPLPKMLQRHYPPRPPVFPLPMPLQQRDLWFRQRFHQLFQRPVRLVIPRWKILQRHQLLLYLLSVQLTTKMPSVFTTHNVQQ